jgi:hypothetical protein
MSTPTREDKTPPLDPLSTDEYLSRSGWEKLGTNSWLLGSPGQHKLELSTEEALRNQRRWDRRRMAVAFGFESEEAFMDALMASGLWARQR